MRISFEKLLGEIAEGIAVSDPRQPDNPLVYVNPAFCQLTGYSEEEVLGRNCRFLQGEESNQSELDRLRAAIREQQPCIVELLNYRKDGTKFWNNLSINPVFDDSGEIVYFTGIQMDVTRRKELEDQQKRFVGDLAHELKTPIAAMMGLTDTLERQPQLSADTRQDINSSMQAQIQRLNQTVETILELSRISFNGPQSKRQLLDMRDVVTEAIDNAADYAATCNVELSFNPPDGPVTVLGDPWTLSMLTGNLLSNAVKYGGEGGKVKVSLQATGHSCRLVVVDQGPGISKEHHRLIFDRFYRIDQSRSRKNGGTGLGLAIVAEVARQHGGYVSVDSAPRSGSTFTVTLPLYERETV